MLDELAAKEKVVCEKDANAPAGDMPSKPREHVTLVLNCNAAGES